MVNPSKEKSSSVHAPSRVFFDIFDGFRRSFAKATIPCLAFPVTNEAPLIEENGFKKRSKKIGEKLRKGFRHSAAATSEPKEEILRTEVYSLSKEEVNEKTDNFGPNYLIGEGKYAMVYSAVLNDGKLVAIKKLKLPSESGFDPTSNADFLTQLSNISKLRHENIIQLLGYYVAIDIRLLSYEHATCSLHTVLHDGKDAQNSSEGPVLDWAQRMMIAYDAAKGLAFLHKANIVHQNIKSSNILLFGLQDVKAKIDFNIGNRSPDEATHLNSTRILGTFGYLAPEYTTAGALNQKSDVYSFGVVLLELLTGRRPLDRTKPKGEHSLVNWATPRLVENQVHQCIDPMLMGNCPMKQVAKFASLAALCVQYDPEFRPKMTTLIKNLELLAGVRAQPSASAY